MGHPYRHAKYQQALQTVAGRVQWSGSIKAFFDRQLVKLGVYTNNPRVQFIRVDRRREGWPTLCFSLHGGLTRERLDVFGTPEPIAIDLGVVFPFFGQIFLRVDSSRRTNWDARPAAD